MKKLVLIVLVLVVLSVAAVGMATAASAPAGGDVAVVAQSADVLATASGESGAAADMGYSLILKDHGGMCDMYDSAASY